MKNYILVLIISILAFTTALKAQYQIIGPSSISACSEAIYTLSPYNNDPISVGVSGNLKKLSSVYPEIKVKPTGYGTATITVVIIELNNNYNQVTVTKNITIIGGPSFIYNNYNTIGDRTIPNNSLISGKFTINNSHTVTINSNVYFTENASIEIKPGGKLIVNGGVLKNYCDNTTWNGIDVLGNPNMTQIETNQGVIRLENSTIENAINAVRIGTDNNNSGGIISAINTTFSNNQNALTFFPYEYISIIDTDRSSNSNISYFQRCNFIIESSYTQNSSTQVSLSSVRGVNFEGCKFENKKILNSGYNFIAINSYKSGFKLHNFCSSRCYVEYGVNTCHPSPTDVSPEIKGFNIGIKCDGAGSTNTFAIQDCSFYKNITNANIANVNNFYIGRSDFNSTYSYQFSTGNYYGIYMNGCSGYTITRNKFYAYVTNISDTNMKKYGMCIDNSGIADNMLLKNTYDKLDYAIYVTRNNGENITTGTGLTFFCNDFKNNINDIVISSNGTIKSYHDSSAGMRNKFHVNTITEKNLYSFNNQQYIVYVHQSSSLYKPTKKSTNIILSEKGLLGYSDICDLEITKQCYISYKTLGSNYNTEDILIEYTELQNENSQLLMDYERNKYQQVIEYAKENPDKITGNKLFKKELNDAINCQNTILSTNSRMAFLSDSCILEILTAPILDAINLKKWYELVNTPVAKYSLVDFYCNDGNYDQAYSVLMDIPNQFNFTMEDYAEHDNFVKLFNFIKNVKLSGRDESILNKEEIEVLKYIADAKTGVSSTRAKGILCFFYNMYCDLDQPKEEFGDVVLDLKDPAMDNYENVIVYPNPAKEIITVASVNSMLKAIQILDVSGKLLKEVSSINENEFTLDINDLIQGVYIIKVNTQNDEFNKKIVKE